jgi:hypothetical protein
MTISSRRVRTRDRGSEREDAISDAGIVARRCVSPGR